MTASECKAIRNNPDYDWEDWDNNEDEIADVSDTIDKALDLLEKKERGLIAELPVPVGSTVYRIDMFTSITKCDKCRFYNHDESYAYSACNISYTDYCHANCYQIETIIDVSKNFIIHHWDEFGKTLFADMKEAKKQLEILRIDGLRTCSKEVQEGFC